ncbi:threonine aldolase, partial [Exophiala aquamarina CBS 119918]
KTVEDKLKDITGKEAALWAVSRTQDNQVYLRTHLTQPPHTVFLDHRAHVHCWESGAPPVMSQASAITVYENNGVHLMLEDVEGNMIADE